MPLQRPAAAGAEDGALGGPGFLKEPGALMSRMRWLPLPGRPRWESRSGIEGGPAADPLFSGAVKALAAVHLAGFGLDGEIAFPEAAPFPLAAH